LDRTVTSLHDFKLARYNDVFLKKLAASRTDREPLCYNFAIKEDEKGRKYIIPSVTLNLPTDDYNFGFANGCVSVDLNVDRISVSNLDKDGNRLESFDVPLELYGKLSGQITDTIGRAMSMVGKYCEDNQKCLVMEDIDLKKKKSGLHYGNKKSNRKVSSFAYEKMTASALSQGFKRKFTTYFVNPAYTSLTGKIRYMKKMGISIHQAASYVIGLRGMGLDDLCRPPDEIICMLPQSLRDANPWVQWKKISKMAAGVRTHAFYRNITEDDWGNRKKRGLKNYIAIMKEKDLASLTTEKEKAKSETDNRKSTQPIAVF